MYFSLELIEEATNCSRYDFSFVKIRELKELVMCRLLKRGIFLELLFTLLNLRLPMMRVLERFMEFQFLLQEHGCKISIVINIYIYIYIYIL